MAQQQTLLSPEKYIRIKARGLPIYECLINGNWQEQGFAAIFIGRRHSNGNITFGNYLIDILCLGLKDTYWGFNEHSAKWNEIKEHWQMQNVPLANVNYNIAHNIIYGAIAFAEEYGLKPHKDFSISQFILEEDDERIPIIDIEFGRKGKPFIVVHPEDSKAKAALKYLKQITTRMTLILVLP